MTNDWRADGSGLYPGCVSRDYHFFKVRLIVKNKVTDEYNSGTFYVSAKRGLHWLESQIPGRYTHPLPTEYFTFSYEVQEVEDCEDILFHHVTTKESWERKSTEWFLFVCANSKWKVSYWDKVKKFFKRQFAFISSRLFTKVTIITQ